MCYVGGLRLNRKVRRRSAGIVHTLGQVLLAADFVNVIRVRGRRHARQAGKAERKYCLQL